MKEMNLGSLDNGGRAFAPSLGHHFMLNRIDGNSPHHVFRDNCDVLRRALDFEVAGGRGRRRPNMTWKKQVEEHTHQTGLKRKDAFDRMKWRNGVYELSKGTT